jgi:hypothetical protein
VRAVLSGKLMYFFLLTVTVTAIVSPLVIWRYGRAVLAGMQRAAGSAPLPLASVPAGPAAITTAATAAPVAAAARLAWERGLRRRVVAAWLVAVAGAALPLALLHNRASELPLTPAHVALPLAVMILVALPPIALSLGWTWLRGLRHALMLSFAAALVVLLVSVLQRLALGRAPSADQALNLLLYYQSAAVMLVLPLALFLASAAARIRGVVPMVFAGLVVFGAAPFFAVDLWTAIADTEAGTRAMLGSAWLSSRHLVLALLALPFGALMWWRLHVLARAYAAKRSSDVQLLARMWWLMFVAVLLMQLLSDRPSWGVALGCAAVVALFAPLQTLAFRVLAPARGAPPPATLLLLRVFGFRARTERLFDRIGARWRYHGPVTMIAAPDVAARTIDPADFLGWLLGRIDDAFVRNADELCSRLAAMDRERDPDGRLRINEFCCADDTWRATVVELMQRADAVLMDLRGLTAGRKGCEFELEQLAQRVQPARVVLVVEPGADRSALAALLGAAAAQVQWFELPGRGGAAHERLFETLLAAAAGQRM